MDTRHPPRQMRGLTLVELAVTLSLVGITLALAAPSIGEFVSGSRLESAGFLLFEDLQLARRTAIAEGRRVALCPSRDGQQCAGGDSWRAGWLVYADHNSNGAFDDADRLIKASTGITGILISLNAASPSLVRFYPTGRAWPNGTFTLCSKRGSARVRQIVVYMTGRSRMIKSADTDPQCLVS